MPGIDRRRFLLAVAGAAVAGGTGAWAAPTLTQARARAATYRALVRSLCAGPDGRFRHVDPAAAYRRYRRWYGDHIWAVAVSGSSHSTVQSGAATEGFAQSPGQCPYRTSGPAEGQDRDYLGRWEPNEPRRRSCDLHRHRARPAGERGRQPAHAATCADYPNQAAAQHAADTRDGDGDGVYCESLPCPCAKPAGDSGGGGPNPAPVGTSPAGCVRPSAVQNISFSKTKYPNVRRHFLAALRKGWPRTLVLNRPGADARRDRLLAPYPTLGPGPRRVSAGCRARQRSRP